MYVCMYAYIYIYICIDTYIYIYIYMYDTTKYNEIIKKTTDRTGHARLSRQAPLARSHDIIY